MTLKILEQTDTPIVTLQEIKAYLRLEHDQEDELLSYLTRLSTQWVEEATGKTLLRKKLAYTHANNILVLPHPPVIEILEVRTRKKVFASDEYGVEELNCGKKIHLPFSWNCKPITVTYMAGFGDETSDVPVALRHAVLTSVADIYENRLNPGRTSSPFSNMQPWIQYHRSYQMV